MRISDISMQYAGNLLFENVSVNFNKGERYALTGANGSGKTTFFKILTGELQPNSGTIEKSSDDTIGVLQQDHYKYDDVIIHDVVLSGNKNLKDAIDKKTYILNKSNPNQQELNSLADLESTILSESGYSATGTITKILNGLGIDSKYHNQPLKVLSGGYKLRVLLAQLLFQSPEILLLDEPTNHLDIVTISWLEQYLIQDFKNTLIVISHDITFLNNIATKVLDIDYYTMTIYSGNYDQALLQKQEKQELLQKTKENQEKKISHMQSYVDRFKAKASKAKQAQSRLKQIEKINLVEGKNSTRLTPKFEFSPKNKSGKIILTANNLFKSYDNKIVLSDVGFELKSGDKLGIIGANGLGKSTLLKILTNQIKPDSGNFKWGSNVETAYVSQDHHETVNGKLSVFNWLEQECQQAQTVQIRNVLGNVLFSKDDIHKSVNKISGGETTRLLLAKMILAKANVLLLDEPTNHLDIESSQALAEALKKTTSSVLVVSHDRHFIDAFVNKLLILTPNEIKMYIGNYRDYQAEHDNYVLSNKTINNKPKISKAEKTRNNKYVRDLIIKIKNLENSIDKTENELVSIEKDLSDSALYTDNAGNKHQKLESQYTLTKARLNKLMDDWQILNEELDEIKNN